MMIDVNCYYIVFLETYKNHGEQILKKQQQQQQFTPIILFKSLDSLAFNVKARVAFL